MQQNWTSIERQLSVVFHNYGYAWSRGTTTAVRPNMATSAAVIRDTVISVARAEGRLTSRMTVVVAGEDGVLSVDTT